MFTLSNFLAFPVRMCALCIVVSLPLRVRAQTPPTTGTDSVRAVLAPIAVTVSRDAARSPFELPFATTRLTPDALRPAQRRLSIGDLTVGVPGVVVQERANPSQDPRLEIRGFGARSAFGVRGVRILRDGIPLSLPDGQTPIDWLELESVGSIEVVRGTAAALYGNAAGGVVDFRSRAPEQAPVAASVRVWNGGGVSRTTATVSGAQSADGDRASSIMRNAGALLTFSKTQGPGPRQYSRLEASNVFARAFATVGGTRLEVQGSRYDTPRADNTGAITAAELARDSRLPDSLNITKRSRKAVLHEQIALLASRGDDHASVNASVFAGTRSLDNPQAFAIVAVERAVAGGSLRGAWRLGSLPWPMRLTSGIDAQRQDDSRLNFENCADATGAATAKCPVIGTERGAIRLDQRERVRGIGAFARAEVEAPGRVFVSLAARRDQVTFRVNDRFITSSNADDSGDRTLAATTPMLGIAWRARPALSVFANWTTAFETPTITELTNQDNGAAGLNGNLLPQKTRTLEAGVHGLLGSRMRLELAAFRAVVHDELVPFDVPNQPGRRAFRNAGQTSRTGVESNIVVALPLVDMGLSYTRSHFRFDRYTVGTANYAGNPIPGIPDQLAQLWATARARGWFATVESTMSSRVTADDAASVRAAGYAVWGVRGGYSGGIGSRHVSIEPVVGMDNVFDRVFATSVVINATRNRYFEPGLQRRVFVSMRVSGR